MEPRDLIAAISTAAGIGAVGIVRVTGQGVPALFEPLLGRRALSPRLATLCNFLGAGGAPIDRGLALYFSAPRSYTGQDVLELHGHGGSAVLELLMARCIELGARPAQPGEFTYRAYMNGRVDLAQAEAVADLIEAKSEAAARSAVRALSGEFSAKVNGLVDAVTRLRVLVEAHLDFPEEDVEFVSSRRAEEPLSDIASALEALRQGARSSQLLRGARVVLVGAPNVGKSSLLNRLAQDEIAIVTAVPGTTRDVVRATLHLHGVEVELLDTAGLRASQDPIEQIGMQRSRAMVSQSHLVLIVDDCSGSDISFPELGDIARDTPSIRLKNKSDLLPNVPVDTTDQIFVSARTGYGIEALRARIAEILGLAHLEEGASLARHRHVKALDEASVHLRCAAQAHDLVLLAEELRLVQSALGQITGQVSSEDLLGQIFSTFCIGK